MRRRKRIVPHFATLFLVCILLVFSVKVVSADWPKGFNLKGSTPVVVAQAKVLSREDPNCQIEVVVGLALRNEDELNELILNQSNPASPYFRRYLTVEQFSEKFSPRYSDVEAVIRFLRANDVQIVSVPSNRLIVVARGKVSNFERAFAVKINRYHYRGKTFRSNDKDLCLPIELKGVISSIVGLNNLAKYQALRENGSTPTEVSPRQGMTPQEVSCLYRFPNDYNRDAQKHYSGAGRTIAIATAFVYDPNDVETYWRECGIVRTGKVIDVPVGGTTSVTHKETTLDLEQIGAQVPGADVLVYMGKDGDSATFEQVFNQIVVDNKADVVSMSWGVCEDSLGMRYMQPLSVIFKEAVAQGIVIFASSGDRGAYDCVSEDAKLSAHYPASDPNVVSVGGTALTLDRNGKRKDESAWISSGGGISSYWSQPSWQKGLGIPNNGKRNVADVALAANGPPGGYRALYKGRWFATGGTSLAAPNWASLWLLADEACGRRIGNAGDVIYRIAASAQYGVVFYDITTGSNGDLRGPGWRAGTGWDYPTGWGVPNGEALVEWLRCDGGPRTTT